MRLEDNYEENEYDKPSENRKMLVQVALGVSLAVITIVGIVIAINYDTKTNKKVAKENRITTETTNHMSAEVQEVHESVQKLVENSGLTSDDLDFWDIYTGKNKDADSVSDNDSNRKKENSKTDEDSTEEGKDGLTDAEADHVNQTKITKSDGTEEWSNISSFITKNKYDENGFIYKDPIMKYYENGKNISYMGVDISKETGLVDFVKLKNAGVQFVMIKVGARGYGNGQLTVDDTFTDYIQKASEAGLDIGVYFYSQAITKEEALEEANLVYENIKDYHLVYPIAFDMEKVSGDAARTDFLTREEKSNLALIFLDALKNVGYKGIIYGNKEWLIKEINLSTVGTYDIWLSQEGEKPDYPYKYSMWQYTQSGTIDGINGDANLDICFINYAMK